VIGFSEVISHLRAIHRIYCRLLKYIDVDRPDAAILVDYPGFNLRLAKELKNEASLSYITLAPRYGPGEKGA